MINTLLGKIENILEKDFLFASFLPTLVFASSLLLLVGDVIGFQVLMAYWESLTANQQAVAVASSGFWILILAYLIFGLRTLFLRLWSGTVEWPLGWFFAPGKWFFCRRFSRLRDGSYHDKQWENVGENFQNNVTPHWKNSGNDIAQKDYQSLVDEIAKLDKGAGTKSVEEFLNNKIVKAYEEYNGNGLLKEVFRTIKVMLHDWAHEEQLEATRKRARLDRQFGDTFSIRPTALGNVVESYNSYSFKRYGMEGEVFWPHLEHVIPDTFRGRIRDVRIMLDFLLTMSTLGIAVALFSFLIGPWLMFDRWHWGLWGGGALIVSYILYYKMAVFVAIQYGELIRASFDLFRLDLLSSLSRVRPTNRDDELKKWKQLSQLFVYGYVENHEIRP